MVKAYLRYEPEGALGVITSAPSIAYVLDGARNGMNSNASASASATAAASSSSSQHRRLLVAAGSLEAVALWDAATGELVARLDPPPSPATGARAREVTSLASLVGSSGSGNSGSGIGGSFLASPQRPLLAVGHADGRVRLWDVSERRMDASLAGHSSAVTCLAFDDDCGGGGGIGEEGEDGGTSGGGGNLLASGGADTDVVVWDVGAESGLCRLRGHAAPVTAVCFVVSAAASDSSAAALLAAAAAAKNPNAKLLSSSSSPSLSSAKKLLVASAAKDGCVRLWHLAAGGACVCTVATGSGELWTLSPAPASFAAGAGGNGAGTLLAGAGVGGEVLLWRVGEAAVGGTGGGTGDDENETAAAAAATTTSRSLPALLPSGTLRRSAPDRATSLSWSVARGGGGGGGGGAGGGAGGGGDAAAAAAGEVPVLVCASSGRVVDVWKGRSAADARRHAARRAKRRRDKDAARAVENGGGGGAGAPSSSSAAAAVEVEAADALEALPALRLKHRVRAAALCPAALLLSSPGTSSSAFGKKRNKAHCPSARLALALSNNVLEFWDVAAAAAASSSSDAAASSSERASSIDGPGHRAPVRALALAPDGRLALAASGDGSAKLWNVETMQHVRSVEPLGSGERGGDGNNSTSTAAVGEGGALSALWAPGGRHAVLGAKAGSLWLVDAATGSASRLLSSSHAGPVWSLSALPDGSGFVSASADKDVKFWEWEVVGSSVSTSTSNPLPSVSARHVRSLRLADDALCAKVSPDGRYLAVALLDSTIQVFHADSLKFALALYGHALPALAFDISSDGALLVSGGADKSVRVWGLDFGDCHRSMRGHADSVTAVAFVPGTHHVFTASKDGSVRYWDADAWQNLLVLDGSGGGFGGSSGPELWCLAVSQDGSLVLSGGADRAVRAWRRGDEPFFVEEENERRLESMFDADADAQAAARANASAAGKDPSPSSLAPGDATTAARPTAEALTAADELVEAMDLADEEDRRREAAASSAAAKEAEEEGGGAAAKGASTRKRQQQQMQQQEAITAAPSLPPSFQPNPLLLGLSPDAFVLRALRGVKPADLEAAALSLPLADALRLLSRVRSLLLLSSPEGGGGGNKAGCPASPELLVRAATLLVRVHAPALAGSRAARSALSRLKGPLRAAARGARDALAENEAALRHLCRAARARGRVA